jgi:hypothetical protein
MALPLSRRSVLRGAALAAVGATGLATALGTSTAQAATKSGPRTTCYVEVNNHSIANVGKYVLESSGAPVFDIALIFAANINYDGKKAYLYNNPQVQATLDNVDTLVRPLQAKGIKVLLSVLGNHQGAGFANFADRGTASAFAAQLASTVYKYGLDGIDFDDEWADYGVNGTSQPNAWSFVYLCQQLRRMMPDKLISMYYIGPSSERVVYNGLSVGTLIDYAVHPYYGGYAPPGYIDVPGLTKRQIGAAAIWLENTSADQANELAERTVRDGYGLYNTYDLQEGDHSEYISSFTSALYGSRAVYTG